MDQNRKQQDQNRQVKQRTPNDELDKKRQASGGPSGQSDTSPSGQRSNDANQRQEAPRRQDQDEH